MESLGKTAYEAYCKDAGGVSLISGAKLPEWGSLDPRIQHAWEAAADAIAQKWAG
jgi:hypothetical protein